MNTVNSYFISNDEVSRKKVFTDKTIKMIKEILRKNSSGGCRALKEKSNKNQ